MKNKALLITPLLFTLLLLIYGFGGGGKWPGGSPGGYTGSPGDGKDCTDCHNGSASQVDGWITSDIPLDGYIPGETYTIFLSATGSGKKGFEVAPQALNGDLLGTLIDGSGVHLVAGNKAVTHDNATSANPAEWQFQWTAPETGTGDVTFYGAFALNKSVTKLSTYAVMENTGISIREYQDLKAEVYPNPAHEELNITFTAEEAGETMVKLIAMDGRSIDLIEDLYSNKGTNSISCQIPQSISPGFYLLQIKQNNQLGNIKLLIR